MASVTIKLSSLRSQIAQLEAAHSADRTVAVTALARTNSLFSIIEAGLSRTVVDAREVLEATRAQHGDYFDSIENVTLGRFQAFNASAIQVEIATDVLTNTALDQATMVQASVDAFMQQAAQLVERIQFLKVNASSQLQLASAALDTLFAEQVLGASESSQVFQAGIEERISTLSGEVQLTNTSLLTLASALSSSQDQLIQLNSDSGALEVSIRAAVLSADSSASVALTSAGAQANSLLGQLSSAIADQSADMSSFSTSAQFSALSLEARLGQLSTSSEEVFNSVSIKAAGLAAELISAAAATSPLLAVASQDLSASLSAMLQTAASTKLSIGQLQQTVMMEHASAESQMQGTVAAARQLHSGVLSSTASRIERVLDQASIRATQASVVAGTLNPQVSAASITLAATSSTIRQKLEELVSASEVRAAGLSQAVFDLEGSVLARTASLQQASAVGRSAAVSISVSLQGGAQRQSTEVSSRHSTLLASTTSMGQAIDASRLEQELLQQTASVDNAQAIATLDGRLETAFTTLDQLLSAQQVATALEVATFSVQLSNQLDSILPANSATKAEAVSLFESVGQIKTTNANTLQAAREQLSNVVTSTTTKVSELGSTLSQQTEELLGQVSLNQLNWDTHVQQLLSNASTQQQNIGDERATVSLEKDSLELGSSIDKLNIDLEASELTSEVAAAEATFNFTAMNLTQQLDVLQSNAKAVLLSSQLAFQEESIESNSLVLSNQASMDQELQEHREEQDKLAQHATGRSIRIRFRSDLDPATLTSWSKSMVCYSTRLGFTSLAQQVQLLMSQPDAWTVVSSSVDTITLSQVYAAHYEYLNQSCLQLHVQTTAGTTPLAAFYSLKRLFSTEITAVHHPPLGQLPSLEDRKTKLTNRLAVLATTVQQLKAQAAQTQEQLIPLWNASTAQAVPFADQHELPIYVLTVSLVLIVIALLLQLSAARRWIQGRSAQANFDFSQDDFDDMVAAAVHRTQLGGSSGYEIPLALVRPNTGLDALGRKASLASGKLKTTDSLRVNPIFEVEEESSDFAARAGAARTQSMRSDEYVDVGATPLAD
jgi:hypothetical protein